MKKVLLLTLLLFSTYAYASEEAKLYLPIYNSIESGECTSLTNGLKDSFISVRFTELDTINHKIKYGKSKISMLDVSRFRLLSYLDEKIAARKYRFLIKDYTADAGSFVNKRTGAMEIESSESSKGLGTSKSLKASIKLIGTKFGSILEDNGASGLDVATEFGVSLGEKNDWSKRNTTSIPVSKFDRGHYLLDVYQDRVNKKVYALTMCVKKQK